MNEHFTITKTGEKREYLGFAIGKHCLKHSPGISQTFEFFKWTTKYYFDFDQSQAEGRLFSVLLNNETMDKVVELKQAYAKSDSFVDFPGQIEVSTIAYITKSLDDELYFDNLESTEIPLMISENLDLPIFNCKELFNEDDHVRLRIISKYDWGRVNWETMELIDPNAEPEHVEAIVLNLHGGSFNGGGSNDRYPYSKQFTMSTGYPVFSVDYRLAPNNPFPNGLSDCFQVYMWLVKYSEKYLQLSFDRIILEGDSAGANMSLNTTALTILRGVRKPDRLVIHYPCAAVGIIPYYPSLTFAYDDLCLGLNFLPGVVQRYNADKDYETHQLVSPVYYSDEIINEFPPMNVNVAENDPIRDGMLRLALRLAKAKREVNINIFKRCQHGFMGHGGFPTEVKLAKTAIEESIRCMQINPMDSI